MWELERVCLYQGMHRRCSYPHCMLSLNRNHPGSHDCHSHITVRLVRLVHVWVQRLCLELVQELLVVRGGQVLTSCWYRVGLMDGIPSSRRKEHTRRCFHHGECGREKAAAACSTAERVESSQMSINPSLPFPTSRCTFHHCGLFCWCISRNYHHFKVLQRQREGVSMKAWGADGCIEVLQIVFSSGSPATEKTTSAQESFFQFMSFP